MVFNEQAKNDPITATVNIDGESQTYRCQFAACKSPTCMCSDLTIHFFQNQSETPLHTVKIDVAKRRLARLKGKKTPAETKVFAKQLVAQLEDDDFQSLTLILYDIKCTATEEADPKTIKASFNVKAIESEGQMYSYQEILPFAPQLIAMIDDESYLLFDRYCLSSTCDCTKTVFSLYTNGKAGRRAKEHCLVQVDYKKKRWTMTEDFTMAVSVDALRDAAEQQIERFYTRLEIRHLKLKSIYFHNELRSPEVLFDPRLEVGRNEPCPCGSGKKYKKCCLRN